MDRSPKRRKVSMTRSIDISPVKISADSAFHTAEVSPSRPSYMSPTRSSLARTNPELLLPPRRSLGVDGAEDDIFDTTNIGKERRLTPKRLNPTPLRSTTPNHGPLTMPPREGSAAMDTEPDSQRASRGKGKRVSFATAADAESNATGVEKENQRSGAGRSSQGTDDASRRSITEPDDRLAALEADMSVQLGDNEEPDLPKLPTPDTPYGPPGLLSSSPSGQAARRLTTRRSMLPPLSRRGSMAIAADVGADQGAGASSLTESTTAPRPDQSGEQDDGFVEEVNVDNTAELQDNTETEAFEVEDQDVPSIPIQPSGPIIIRDVGLDAKRDELEVLLREKRRLNDEVDFLEGAVVTGLEGRALRDSHDSSVGRVLDSILHGQGSIPRGLAKEKTSQRLASYLPFTNRNVAFQKLQDVPDVPNKSTPPEFEDKLSSLFTPLQVKGQQKAVFFEDKHMQEHQLTIESTGGLLVLGFGVQIDSVNGRTFQIGRRQEIPLWMKPEFDQLVKQHLGGEGSPGTCDINTIGTAVTQYWHLSNSRALAWEACCEDHQDLVVDSESDATSRSDDNAIEGAAVGGHLGRQTLRLEKGGVGLLVTWIIDFDWIGNARSHVSACAAFPASWRDRDDTNAFDHAGELFELFLRRFGVRRAVATMVELMFGKTG